MVIRVLLSGVVVLAGCDDGGTLPFGASCHTSGECASSVCVGGESTTEFEHIPFCSEECHGESVTGNPCADGAGVCANDFLQWCWVPCETDEDCRAVNDERARCEAWGTMNVCRSSIRPR